MKICADGLCAIAHKRFQGTTCRNLDRVACERIFSVFRTPTTPGVGARCPVEAPCEANHVQCRGLGGNDKCGPHKSICRYSRVTVDHFVPQETSVEASVP